MKSIVTLLFIFLSSTAALATTNDHGVVLNPQIESYDQNEISKVGLYLDSGIIVATKYTEVETATEREVARLYKFKNARIKKALAFSTKKSKAKMA